MVLFAGLSTGFFAVFARLVTMGFLYPIGLLSGAFFGLLHVRYILFVFRNFTYFQCRAKVQVWFGIFLFPLIFLFQFELEDRKPTFYVYEHLMGQSSSAFEYFAFYVAIGAAALYILNFLILMRYLKAIKRHKPFFQTKNT